MSELYDEFTQLSSKYQLELKNQMTKVGFETDFNDFIIPVRHISFGGSHSLLNQPSVGIFETITRYDDKSHPNVNLNSIAISRCSFEK